MGHDQDFWEPLRNWFARPIGRLLTGVRKRKTGEAQFVGYVEMKEGEFEEELHKMGFERNPLSYWKYIPGEGGEEGSWRKTDGDWQLHAILFDGHPEKSDEEEAGETYIYAHWEYRWDRHPLKHLRGKETSASKGVNQMRRELKLASINYYNDSTIR